MKLYRASLNALKMKKDYVFTFLTEGIVLAAGIFVYKFAAVFIGTEGFYEYALSRRTISLIHPLLTMGLGVAIPRYIAYHRGRSNPGKSDAYFLSGLSILIIAISVFTLVCNLFEEKIAFLVFGNCDYYYLIFPINLMLIGLVLHSCCYSYYRGRLLMSRANSLQFINMGFVPLIAFFLGKNTVQVLNGTGSAWIVISVLFTLSVVKNLVWEMKHIKRQAKELLIYGIQRVPGDFGLGALLTLPATFTAHISGVEKAGHVAFGISLLNMVATAFAPISVIFLPKAAQIIANKDFVLLRYYILRLIKITVSLTAIGILFFEIFADRIIAIYLGRDYFELVGITRIVMIGAMAYNIFFSMRSFVDAYYVKAINAKNVLISLLIFLVSSGLTVFLAFGYVYLVACFTASICVMGGLTLVKAKSILKETSGIHGYS